MNPAFIFSFIAHAICEIAAACGLIYWISEIWNLNPAPAIVRLARHPGRLWIACGLAVIPPVFGTLLTAMIFSGSHTEMARLIMPLYYFLSFFWGAVFGLAASCCAGRDGTRFRMSAACVIAVLLVLAPPWLMASRWLMLAMHIFCRAFIVIVSGLLLDTKTQPAVPAPPAAGTPPPFPHKSSPAPALIIGFLPAIFVLLAITMGASGISDHMSNEESRALLWLASIASVACCIVSSVMLFKRKTGAAVAGAIMFLLLNAFLSFFFGCCASLVGASWH